MDETMRLLPGLTAVRRRPTLYVGALDHPLLANQLLCESLCCARDDALAGRCARAEIRLHSDHVATVEDWGPGLPLTPHASGRPLAEVYLTTLHACADAKACVVAETTCTFGLAALNALCSKVHVEIRQHGVVWSQHYADGVPLGPFRQTGSTDTTGTMLHFALDRTLLPDCRFDAAALRAWASGAVHGMALAIHDLRN